MDEKDPTKVELQTSRSTSPLYVPESPRELPADRRRQAVPSIQGTVYQAWASIEAWLQLRSADEVIYLEGAEDFDVVRSGDATSVQVKHRKGSISLGNKSVRDALENFWTLATAEPTRRVELHYLTTSNVTKEQDAEFDGMTGIQAWRAAITNEDYARSISDYLYRKLPSNSALAEFLRTASVPQLQEMFFGRFHWLTEQPDMESVKRSVLERIAVRLREKNQPVSLSDKVRLHLESRFWQVVILQPSSQRCLTLGDLLLQIEEATTVYLPVSLHQIPDLLGNQSFGPALLDLLLEKRVRPPEPLLHRPELVARVRALVAHRQAVLLTGTVHKGKTTIAQLVAAELCPSAWWIKLSGRRADQVDTLLLALATRIDAPDCPSIIVLDDLDTSPSALNVFNSALQLVVHRTLVSGRAILLTARGTLNETPSDQDLACLETIVVPELSEEEIAALCVEFDCPAETVKDWSRSIWIWTLGHPKLVQVRIVELKGRGWPTPCIDDLLKQSAAITSARQLSRRLLSESQSEPVTEFLYMAAELLVPMDKTLALLLADSTPGLRNAGDVIENLSGQWLEQVESGLLRPTTLLKGAAADVWSKPKLLAMHAQLHDVIISKGTLNQMEAAALLFHAFMADDRKRLAHSAMQLQLTGNQEVQRGVFQQLTWLPMIALEPGQTFTDDPFTDASIRSLQFKVATLLQEDVLARIAERWIETVAQIDHEEARIMSEAMLWPSIGISESNKLGLSLRLSAIAGMRSLQDSQFEAAQMFRDLGANDPGVPEGAHPAELMFLMATREVRSLESLNMLISWLEQEATDVLRTEFESLLSWSSMQNLGAFVQGAWVACHEDTKDWNPWLDTFDLIDQYAKRFSSPNFGREAAKAKATVLTEYLGRSTNALEVLAAAEAAFGSSAILIEQRANVLFQQQDNEGVLRVWEELRQHPDCESTLDPFAFRRVAMSAARLGRFDLATEVFLTGASNITHGEHPQTKFGLLIDAAVAMSLENRYTNAAKTMSDAVLALPSSAQEDGDVRWEAVQRTATEICRQIEARWKHQKPSQAELQPGYASSPDLKVAEAQPRQLIRSEYLILNVIQLAASLGVTSEAALESEARRLMESDIPYLRFLAAQAQFSIVMRDGAWEGFVTTLVAFDSALADMTRINQERLFEPDSGHRETAAAQPEKWIGFLAAGLCCSTCPVIETLEHWHEECVQALGSKSDLALIITAGIDVLKDTNCRQVDIIGRPTEPAIVRFAAAKSLLDIGQTPELTARFQGFLTSGAVSDASYEFQQLFNHHIAARFAPVWIRHAQAPFRLVNPRHNVPAIVSVCEQVIEGRATLKELLDTCSTAAGVPIGEFIARVW